MHADSHFPDHTFATLICDVPRPSVARITLNRADKRNALCRELIDELAGAFTRARNDDRVRCITLAAVTVVVVTK